MAVRECLERSWWLRRLKPDSRWLIRQAVAFLNDDPGTRDPCLVYGPLAERHRLSWRCALDRYLADQLPRLSVGRFRRWVLRWVAVSLVADLVFQWWLSRKVQGNGFSTWAP
jgi:hypothetical protein